MEMVSEYSSRRLSGSGPPANAKSTPPGPLRTRQNLLEEGLATKAITWIGMQQDAYKQSGVDTAEADAGLGNIIRRVQGTWPKIGLGKVVLPIGYFANVIEMDGVGLALCTDGVGSKTIIATMMRK